MRTCEKCEKDISDRDIRAKYCKDCRRELEKESAHARVLKRHGSWDKFWEEGGKGQVVRLLNNTARELKDDPDSICNDLGFLEEYFKEPIKREKKVKE